jgi:hypothetical protein
MNLADETLRDRILADGPVGAWRTVPGTHTVLADESILFNRDGTGAWRCRSFLSGNTVQSFVWRVAGHGVVECQPVYEAPQTDAAGSPEASDWFRLALVIEPHATDTGTCWVLRERNSDGFWELAAPLVPAD